jgi:CHASE2 domain-containing sensor protein
MTKPQLYKEALIASLLVIVVDILLSFVPWKFELIRPIKQGFNDFNVYDLRYSGTDSIIGKKDTNITLLEIGATRAAISEQLNLLAAFHPRAVAIDAIFNQPGDPSADTALVAALKKIPNLILASQYEIDSAGDRIRTSFFQSDIPGYKDGFFNFVEGPEEIKRHFLPFLSINGKPYPSMTTRLLQTLDSNAYETLKNRDNPVETINYRGGLNHYNVVPLDRLIHPLHNEDLTGYFHDKVVLIGFFKAEAPDILEDIHFTPMNERRGGKSFPDTYGVVIHANILEELLGRHYIHTLPDWSVYALTFIIIFFINIFYIRRISRSQKHNHFLLFLLQFVLAIGLLYLALLIFDWFDIAFDPMPMLIAVVLSFEIFWLYEWLAVKMNKLFGYATFLHE